MRRNSYSRGLVLMCYAVKDLRDFFFFASGLKEFIKCCTILGLLVYMSYKQYEPHNRVFFRL